MNIYLSRFLCIVERWFVQRTIFYEISSKLNILYSQILGEKRHFKYFLLGNETSKFIYWRSQRSSASCLRTKLSRPPKCSSRDKKLQVWTVVFHSDLKGKTVACQRCQGYGSRHYELVYTMSSMSNQHLWDEKNGKGLPLEYQDREGEVCKTFSVLRKQWDWENEE